jgi:hypothetical protein
MTGGGQTFSGNLSNQNQTGGTQLITGQQAPSISAPSTNTGRSNTAVNASNFLGATYANPYYQGTLANNRSNVAPGGFGQQTFGNTGGAGGGNLGYAGTGGAGGQFGGGQYGRGGVTGSVNTSDPGGILVPLPRQIAYSAQVQFKPEPVQAGPLYADLRGTLDRSTMLSNPRGVAVLVNGNTVVLRGVVRDEDEARAIEGMVRLTPGVREVRNELTFPVQP